MSLATARPTSIKTVQVRQAGDMSESMLRYQMDLGNQFVTDWYYEGRYQKGRKVLKGTKVEITFPLPQFPNRLAELAFKLGSEDSWHDMISERELRERNGQ